MCVIYAFTLESNENEYRIGSCYFSERHDISRIAGSNFLSMRGTVQRTGRKSASFPHKIRRKNEVIRWTGTQEEKEHAPEKNLHPEPSLQNVCAPLGKDAM